MSQYMLATNSLRVDYFVSCIFDINSNPQIPDGPSPSISLWVPHFCTTKIVPPWPAHPT